MSALPTDLPGQRVHDAQCLVAGGTLATDQSNLVPHPADVGGDLSGSDQPPPETHLPIVAADSLLLIYADSLDDLERVRIATENRVRSLVQVKGMDGTPEQARLTGLTDGLRVLEHGAELELKRALRSHPLGQWVKATVGIGEKQGARLLAAIGDPYWNTLHDRPRTVSELWAYCGYHVLPAGQGVVPIPSTRNAGGDPSSDPDQSPQEAHHWHVGVAPSRRRGQRANWNATAKMRAFLVAESCMKNRRSPYRAVYDDGRAKYAESVHAAECRRCGPAGKPAQPGSPLSDGHKHARALRLVAKAVLRDLWIEAKRLHDEAAS